MEGLVCNPDEKNEIVTFDCDEGFGGSDIGEEEINSTLKVVGSDSVQLFII
jgi:hypothetical protein